MLVRQAKIADYAALIELVKEFFETTSFAHLEIDIDVESVAQLVSKLTTEHLILLLETDDKRIVGGIGGILTPFLFNAKIKIFQELFFYIRPAFRKYSARLLIELGQRCREMNLDRMILGFPANGQATRLERFYRMKGFKKLETHFIKRVNV